MEYDRSGCTSFWVFFFSSHHNDPAANNTSRNMSNVPKNGSSVGGTVSVWSILSENLNVSGIVKSVW